MKYIANPVEVDAWKITDIETIRQEGSRFIALENHSKVLIAPEMLSRIAPQVGDYYVRQADGYVYLNPKDVFERKYRPAEPNAFELGAAVRQAGLAGS
jgi:hypothetical protein